MGFDVKMSWGREQEQIGGSLQTMVQDQQKGK